MYRVRVWMENYLLQLQIWNDFQSDISTRDYVAIQSARHPTLAWCKVKISFLMSCYALCILQINSLILPSPFLTKTSFTAAYVKK